MDRSLRIVVADDDRFMRELYRKILPTLGHQVVGLAANGRELVDQSRAARPNLIIADVQMPVLDGLAAARELAGEGMTPIVIVSGNFEPEWTDQALAGNILAYLVKPVGVPNLGPALTLAARWSGEVRALRTEAADLRQALEDRKIIDRAKGLLMKQTGIDEPTAYRRLQKMARDRNQRVVEAARLVIDAAAVFERLV